MKETVFLAGGIYGTLGIILGAFGAHGLKAVLTIDQLKSFETGVRYQMYHALMLLILGIIFPMEGFSQVLMAWFFILGVFFFSFSIYGLLWSATAGRKTAFLGPVTPLGGFLLVLGWILFTVNALKGL